MLKIGILGFARSGKDTVARYLTKHYGFKRFAFADRLKTLCTDLFPEEMAEGKNRPLLQSVGQALRAVNPSVWINVLFRDINGVERVVVTDVRLENEYKRLKAEGFYIIRVNCPRYLRIERMHQSGDNFTEEDLSHETESYIDSFTADFEVYNSGSLRDLYEQIDVIMREIHVKEAEYLGTR